MRTAPVSVVRFYPTVYFVAIFWRISSLFYLKNIPDPVLEYVENSRNGMQNGMQNRIAIIPEKNS